MELIHEFDYHASLKPPVDVGATPGGHRLMVEVSGGRIEGERVKADFLTGGGDWLLIGADGWGRLDVRAQARTDDGAVLYLQYFGVLEMTPKVQAALGGEAGTEYGDQYFRTSPRFETGDERYAWMNHTVFVGEGHIRAGRIVEYRVFRVA